MTLSSSHGVWLADLDEPNRVRFVEFEDRDVCGQPAGPGRSRQDGCDRAADEIRAGVVGEHLVSLGEHGRHHLGRGGLAVGARDNDDSLRQPAQHAGQVAREQPLDDQPGQRVAGATERAQRQQDELAHDGRKQVGEPVHDIGEVTGRLLAHGTATASAGFV